MTFINYLIYSLIMVKNCYLPPNLGTPGFDGPSEMILIVCHDPKYDGVVLAKKRKPRFCCQ